MLNKLCVAEKCREVVLNLSHTSSNPVRGESVCVGWGGGLKKSPHSISSRSSNNGGLQTCRTKQTHKLCLHAHA